MICRTNVRAELEKYLLELEDLRDEVRENGALVCEGVSFHAPVVAEFALASYAFARRLSLT